MRSPGPVSSQELRDRRLSAFVASLAIVAIAGHALILVFAAVTGLRGLFVFNIGSVALYTVLYLLNRIGRYSIVLATAIVEVLVHAIFATVLIGWDSAFHLYVLCLIPLLFYVDRWPVRVRGAASVVILIVYVAFAVVADRFFPTPPPRVVPLIPVARYGNMAIAAGVLIALSGFYQAAVARAERYMGHYSKTLEKLSLTDTLTGTMNRRGTTNELEQALSASSRSESPFAVILIDLDHFKMINDHHGHEAGDAVLTTVARALTDSVRGSDSVGRWGGEEFLAVLPDTGVAGARFVAERIANAIKSAVVYCRGGREIRITATLGVAIYDPGTNTLPPDEARTTLLADADAALYEGKAAGRDQIVFAALPARATLPARNEAGYDDLGTTLDADEPEELTLHPTDDEIDPL